MQNPLIARYQQFQAQVQVKATDGNAKKSRPQQEVQGRGEYQSFKPNLYLQFVISRNPNAIRDTRKWNPIVYEQEVVICQPGLNLYLIEYVMSLDYSSDFFKQSYHFACLAE